MLRARHRSVIALALLCAAAPASANKASNPAFLGIGMEDLGGGPKAGPCMITSIERGSGAESAGLQRGDVFERLDGAVVASCEALVGLITARSPGTLIQLELRRHAQPVKLRAELLTRDEILRRRLVGYRPPASDLLRVDDKAVVDLGAVKRTTVVAWFPMTCAGCSSVIDDVARWSRERKDARAPISVVAAASDLMPHRSTLDNMERFKATQRSLDVPLLAADYETYSQFAMRDADRVHFMVIDCRGIVQYVAPVVPNAEDMGAVLDELYAAAEQTARRLTR